jgi:hypothetical protein
MLNSLLPTLTSNPLLSSSLRLQPETREALRGNYLPAATTVGLSALPFGKAVAPIARGLKPAARSLANFFAPRRVGVHHSIAGTDLGSAGAGTIPYWRSRFVNPSTVPYGKGGVTSSDQIPGMSYYWDATGRGSAARAAHEGINQPNLLTSRKMMDPSDTVSRAMVVTPPRFGTTPDVNPLVQGGVARMYPGQLKITGEIAGTPGVPVRIPGSKTFAEGGIPYDKTKELTQMIQRQKAIEAARSAGRLGAAGGAIYGANNVDMQALQELLR